MKSLRRTRNKAVPTSTEIKSGPTLRKFVIPEVPAETHVEASSSTPESRSTLRLNEDGDTELVDGNGVVRIRMGGSAFWSSPGIDAAAFVASDSGNTVTRRMSGSPISRAPRPGVESAREMMRYQAGSPYGFIQRIQETPGYRETDRLSIAGEDRPVYATRQGATINIDTSTASGLAGAANALMLRAVEEALPRVYETHQDYSLIDSYQVSFALMGPGGCPIVFSFGANRTSQYIGVAVDIRNMYVYPPTQRERGESASETISRTISAALVRQYPELRRFLDYR